MRLYIVRDAILTETAPVKEAPLVLLISKLQVARDLDELNRGSNKLDYNNRRSYKHSRRVGR